MDESPAPIDSSKPSEIIRAWIDSGRWQHRPLLAYLRLYEGQPCGCVLGEILLAQGVPWCTSLRPGKNDRDQAYGLAPADDGPIYFLTTDVPSLLARINPRLGDRHDELATLSDEGRVEEAYDLLVEMNL